MHTTFPPSVCTCFLSFPSFALRLPVHPQLSVLCDPHHGLLGPLHSPQLLLLQDQTALENVPFSQEEVVGPGEVVGHAEGTPACLPVGAERPRATNLCPLCIWKIIRVIVGGINSLGNICYRIILELSSKKGRSSPQIVSL